MRQHIFIRLIVVTATCLTLFAACQNNLPVDDSNFVVDPAGVCTVESPLENDPCSEAIRNWRWTVDNLLEVYATDFTHGDYVGTECEAEDLVKWDWPPIEFNTWRPMNGLKLNMSGKLHRFNRAEDSDWSLYTVPNPPFSFLISDVEAKYPDAVEAMVHQVCGGDPCMEAEIRPEASIYPNSWFFDRGTHPADTEGDGYSILEGKQIGLYGVWVADANHDFASEIHPLRMLWFKDQYDEFDIFYLWFLQDDTGHDEFQVDSPRFDDKDDFDCEGEPAGWQPWNESPLSGQFNIAFEVDPNTEVVNFNIFELRGYQVKTSLDATASHDVDDGILHGLEYNGKVVVRVQENQPDDDLGVTFTSLSLSPEGKLRGFVSLRSKIGLEDDDVDEAEGYHVLWVTRNKGTTPTDFQLPDNLDTALFINSREVENSVKNGGEYFSGDIQLTLKGADSTSERDFTISKIEFESQNVRQEIAFEQNPQTREVLVRNIPLIAGGRIILTSASGRTSVYQTLALRLGSGIEERLTRSGVDLDGWQFLSASVGGIPNAALPNDRKLAHLQQVQLQLHPRYVPAEENEILFDFASQFAIDLNQTIMRNDPRRLEEFFGSAQPFQIVWALEATNLATGQTVPVFTDNQLRSEGVQIELLSSQFENDSLKVNFLTPGSAGIIECVVTATVTDAMGQTTTVTHHLWSHGFPSTINSVEELSNLVMGLTGIQDRSVLIAPAIARKPGEIGLAIEARTRYAQIMDGYFREALMDDQVTIEELRNILRALNMFALR